MTDAYDAARELAGELLGQPLNLPLAPGEPESGNDFRRLATLHTFGDSWTRTQQLDTRTRRPAVSSPSPSPQRLAPTSRSAASYEMR
jgi:hypothetical protein